MTIPLIDTDEVVTLVSDATATTTEPYYVVDESHINTSEGELTSRSYIHAGQTNGTTAVEITDSANPTVEKRVELKSMSIHNADTVTRTLTLSFKRVSTSYIIWEGALAAGETFFYAHDGTMGVI